MNLRRVQALMLRQFYLLRGSPTRLLPLFAWVAIDIVLWGFITRYLNAITQSGMNFVPALLGAVLLWDFLTRVMQGVTMAFFEDVWSRNFLNLFATPMQFPEYMMGLVLTGISTSFFGLVVMAALASAVFGLSFFVYGVTIVPCILILFLSGIALGLFGSAIVLRLGPAAEWLIWPIPAILSPFAGVFYPLSTLPVWMRGISYLLPPSYAFEALRGVVTGDASTGISLLGAVGLAAAYVVVAGFAFWRVYRYAVRTGLVARYSAETVS
jgi:ABC-2 type transport system permease protein